MANPQQPSTSGRRLLVFSLLFLALTGAGLWVVYQQFADRSLTFDWRLFSPWTLATVGGLLLVYFASDGLRLYFTLRALGYRVRPRAIARLVFINIFFSNVTPMATGGGFAQIWYLQREGVPLGFATAATTIRTVLAVAFIFSLAPVFLMTLPALKNQPLLGQITWILSLLIVLYLGFFAVVLFRTRWLIRPLTGLLSLLDRWHLISPARHRRWQFKARREMMRFSRSFGFYVKGDRRWVGLSVACTAVFLLSLFSFPWLLMTGLDYDVSWLNSLGLLVVTTFIMYFSPTPGASGISEGVFGSFFRDILSGNHLVLVTIAWRVVTIYLGMLIGLVLLQRDLARSHRK
ncbi:lysylphosphatidylglycerol synthase transmembrane domain-containing protein [Marinobacter sp. OP 3.4]|uniref:lysylphosphatidylglycerol synthase transmembrane domain-containing protein n=1 Tax=Marinobacter sp. OP 3.4 TaxID=3076501 RepID=UPI002E236BB7